MEIVVMQVKKTIITRKSSFDNANKTYNISSFCSFHAAWNLI